ncbi:serine hydrolase [Terrimonas alba]|uniref:serine hydrolase n=1 Tax=Terrimonas alba TaxID=3349636 RepID=UPI0035F3A615
MKHLLFVFSCFVISACSGQNARLEELLHAYAGQDKFNGSAFIVHKGKILLDKGYGLRNAGDKIRNDRNSIFQIGSITKQFTATILLKLQEGKKLNTTDKLSKYFPAYPNGDSITLEHLLTHTSGIYSYTDDRAFMSTEVAKPSNREKMMALFKDKPLQFSPGSKWQYSNSAYMLLGYIIEDVTKMPYEQAVRKYIFNPLHMDHSGFDFTHLANKEKAIGYFRLTDDTNIPAPIVDSSVSYAAGAIYSTTGDLYKWHLSLQANTIMSKSSKQKAYTAVKNNYGYGWVTDSSAGKRTIGHGGGIHGFNSNMVSIPDDNTCIILLANVANPHLDKITKSILAILYDKPYELPKEKKSISLPPDVLKQYIGVYDLSPQLIITVSFENGKLIGKPEGQEALQLHPEKEDQFFLKGVEAQINFYRNEKKEIVAMSILQNGKETKGNKR